MKIAIFFQLKKNIRHITLINTIHHLKCGGNDIAQEMFKILLWCQYTDVKRSLVNKLNKTVL